MKTVITKTLFTSLAVLSFSTQLLAEEPTQDQLLEKNDHVVINSRPLNPEMKKMLEERRLQEAQENLSEEKDDEYQAKLGCLNYTLKKEIGTEVSHLVGTAIPIKSLFSNYGAFSAYSKMGLTAVSSPYIYHWIKAFPQDGIIQMEDGTEWTYDNKEVIRQWRLGDTITISPKIYSSLEYVGSSLGLYDCKYSYTLINRDLSVSVDVIPFQGPVRYGQFSTWVQGIDYNKRHIYVLNGQQERTIWEVANADADLFKDWQANDSVIIGSDNSWLWWFSPYDHVIINVEMNHYVHAKPLMTPDPIKQQQYQYIQAR